VFEFAENVDLAEGIAIPGFEGDVPRQQVQAGQLLILERRAQDILAVPPPNNRARIDGCEYLWMCAEFDNGTIVKGDSQGLEIRIYQCFPGSLEYTQVVVNGTESKSPRWGFC
jgi:hypothetical protein